MYNYYTYLKQQLEEDQKDVNTLREREQSIAHRHLTNSLVEKYNRRINKFAFEMVKNPLIIRDHDNPIETTRKMFMEESSSKHEGGRRKRFVFNHFITEKQMVMNYLEEQKKLKGIEYDKNKQKSEREDIFNEAVIDSKLVRDNCSYKRYTSHSNKLDKYKPQSPQLNSMSPHQINKSIDIQQKQKGNNKNRYKTHFKALTYLADKYFLNVLTEKPLSPTTSHLPFASTSNCFYAGKPKMNKSSSEARLALAPNTPQSLQPVELIRPKPALLKTYFSRFPLKEENIDILETNPLLYNLNIHPNSYKANEISHSKDNDDKLEYLKNIAFVTEKKELIKGRNLFRNAALILKKSVSESGFKDGLSNFYKHFVYKNTDKVIIDNEEIDKKNIDIIAKKILKKCNYVHKKSRYNNTCLKKGEGKMMITAGMTLNDFKKKFCLK